MHNVDAEAHGVSSHKVSHVSHTREMPAELGWALSDGFPVMHGGRSTGR